ncbi:hypothetical protein D3C87_1384180 [compost metagenome]
MHVRHGHQAERCHDHARCNVPAALARPVRMLADDNHAGSGDAVRNHGQQADMQGVGHVVAADHRREPEADDVEAGRNRKVDGRQCIQPRIPKGSPEGGVVAMAARRTHGVDDDRSFPGGKPLGVGRLVGEYEVDKGTQDDGGNGFDDEQPLPAGEP